MAVSGVSGDRYLVVSQDSHAGPSLDGQLRAYCPNRYLEAFDEFSDGVKRQTMLELDESASMGTRPPAWFEALERTRGCAGHEDPVARLADMDAQGIAAEAIFAGGMNSEVLPWIGVGSPGTELEFAL